MQERMFRNWILSLIVVGGLALVLTVLVELDKVPHAYSGGVYEAAIALGILFLFDAFAGFVLV